MIPTSTVTRSVEIGLHLTGIWPNSCILFRLLWSAVMGTGLIFQYYYLLTHFSVEELPNLIDGLSTTLPYSLLFFKLIVLWINNRYVLFFLVVFINLKKMLCVTLIAERNYRFCKIFCILISSFCQFLYFMK